MDIIRTFEVRWADVDANGHMRHSAFYDYGTHLRIIMFEEFGCPINKMMALGVGPALFREEARFYKELNLNQKMKVDVAVKRMRRNGKIWIIQHQFFNSEDELVAVIIAEGTWIDLATRKAVSPPTEMQAMLPNLPHTADFDWLPDKREETQ
ncbi:MAG: thioesterase family protein [Pseudomonadota bacterium]|nr:thioesterase family protein [Pseudomonadota bacterium]